jgi:hypothetical protein
MNCDFLTRSKWSFDAKTVPTDEETLLLFVVVVMPSLNVAYNVCGEEYDVVISLI